MEIERTFAWKRANQKIQKESSTFCQNMEGGYRFHQTPEGVHRKSSPREHGAKTKKTGQISDALLSWTAKLSEGRMAARFSLHFCLPSPLTESL